MKITVEATTEMREVFEPGRGGGTMRVWKGVDEEGAPLTALIFAIKPDGEHSPEVMERWLKSLKHGDSDLIEYVAVEDEE